MPHKDPAERREYMRTYKRGWVERNRIDVSLSDRAANANQRAERYGVPGRITIDDVRSVIAAGVCFYCGDGGRVDVRRKTEPRDGLLTIDHRVPLHRGGSNDPSNLVAACFSCNARKSRKATPDSWSQDHECCIECGGADRPHAARGRCSRCEQRQRKRERGSAA